MEGGVQREVSTSSSWMAPQSHRWRLVWQRSTLPHGLAQSASAGQDPVTHDGGMLRSVQKQMAKFHFKISLCLKLLSFAITQIANDSNKQSDLLCHTHTHAQKASMLQASHMASLVSQLGSLCRTFFLASQRRVKAAHCWNETESWPRSGSLGSSHLPNNLQKAGGEATSP